jgi:hypothetical protein
LNAEGLSLELLCDWIEESYRIAAPKRLGAELDRRTAPKDARAGSGTPWQS